MSVASTPRLASWPVEPGSGRGRSHGTSSRDAFDRWFRYPAGFASDYVGLLLDRLQVEEGIVVDCFTGSGVTGTAARARGLGFAGIEAHPLIAELARLKLNPSASGEAVRHLAEQVAGFARTLLESAPTGWERALEAEPDLVRRSFANDTLYVLVVLREAIKKREEDAASDYLKWALLATLRDVAGVKVGWPYQRPGVSRKPRHSDALKRFLARVDAMAHDLDLLTARATPSGMLEGTELAEPPVSPVIDGARGGSAPASVDATIVTGDSTDPAAWAQLPGQGAACVASPPYLNNFDYADATRLELYFWGEVTTWRDMCLEVRADMVTATTQQSSVNGKSEALEELRTRQATSPQPAKEIIDLVAEMTSVKSAREKRSKEYDQVAPAYFVAMWDVLENLHTYLASGSSALWLVGDSAPYGVYIDTPRLIGEIAEAVGFTFTEDVHLRTRGDRWGQNTDRHKVKLAERLIVLNKT